MYVSIYIHICDCWEVQYPFFVSVAGMRSFTSVSKSFTVWNLQKLRCKEGPLISQTSKVPPSIPPLIPKQGPDSLFVKPSFGLVLGWGWYRRGYCECRDV